MPKIKRKKCKAITNSGKKCNKDSYLKTNYCIAHQGKNQNLSDLKNEPKVVWYKSSPGKYFIWGSIITIIVALVFYIATLITGPSKENQEKIIQKQNLLNEKQDTLNYSILKLTEYIQKPKNPDEYEKERKKFEEKTKKLEGLKRILETSNKITKDSLDVLKQEFYNYKKELEKELANLKLTLKEIRKVNDRNFKDIFPYGFATFVIDAEKKLNIVDTFTGIEKKIEVNWKSFGLSIDKNSIIINGVNLKQLENHYEFDAIEFHLLRKFGDIAKFYLVPFMNTGDFRIVYSILTDNSKGITFILGLVPYINKSTRQEKRSI